MIKVELSADEIHRESLGNVEEADDDLVDGVLCESLENISLAVIDLYVIYHFNPP